LKEVFLLITQGNARLYEEGVTSESEQGVMGVDVTDDLSLYNLAVAK